MFDFLIAGQNLPFTVAICLMLVITFMEGVGTLLGSGLSEVVESLMPDFDLDVDIRSTTIWSLSQIGGKKVRKVIQKILEETDDEEEIIFIENALENLEFSESFPDLNIMNIDIENLGEDEDLNDYFPLDELDDDDDEWKQ